MKRKTADFLRIASYVGIAFFLLAQFGRNDAYGSYRCAQLSMECGR